MPNFIQNFKFFGIEYEFISEIYGKNLSDKELEKSVYDYKNCFITLGKIGCALSHLKIYQKMLDENIPYALILEDDAIFTQDTLKYIRKIDEFLKQSDFELVLLMHQGDEWFGNLNIKINDEINLYELSKGQALTDISLRKELRKNCLK